MKQPLSYGEKTQKMDKNELKNMKNMKKNVVFWFLVFGFFFFLDCRTSHVQVIIVILVLVQHVAGAIESIIIAAAGLDTHKSSTNLEPGFNSQNVSF